MVCFQDSATSRHGREDAVGDVTILHSSQEFVDDFVPCAVWREGMCFVVGDDLDIALAERNEQQESMRLVRICDHVRVEFTMRELPGVSMLDALRHDRAPRRKPFEQQRYCAEQPQLD